MQQPSKIKPSPARPCESVMSGMIRREAFEDLAGCVTELFDIHTVQLEPGAFQAQLDFIAGNGIVLYRENYPRRTHLEGELRGNRFGISIPLLTAEAKFLGEAVDDSRTSSSVSGESFDLVMEHGYEQMVLLMDHAKLLQMAEQISLRQPSLEALLLGRKGKILQTHPHDIQRLRRTFTRMLDAAHHGRLNISEDDFEKMIFDSILPVIDRDEYVLDRGSASITVHRALDLAYCITGPICISDLCIALNISPRTLHKAFIQIMGMPPHRFFQKRRLSQAHRMLVKADSRESRVTDIAAQLGFTELGRFSGQYRELFGESPSETIRRPQNCTVGIPWSPPRHPSASLNPQHPV